MLGTEEFRFPLDPETALVCTWLDEPDGSPVIAGTHDLAASLNRAAIAQADAEWFYRPGRRPTTITPTNFAPEGCAPVGRLLLPGYGAGHVRGSRRLLETKRNMEKMVEDGPSDRVVIAKVAPAP